MALLSGKFGKKWRSVLRKHNQVHCSTKNLKMWVNYTRVVDCAWNYVYNLRAHFVMTKKFLELTGLVVLVG